MRDYMVRYCKTMLPLKGIDWLKALYQNNKITQEEYIEITK